MRLEPQSDAGYLSDSRILPLYESKDRNDRKLHYESTELGLAFDYDADWYATAEDRQAVVFRQLMRGDLIAQCNVSKLPNIKKGKALTLSQFEKGGYDSAAVVYKFVTRQYRSRLNKQQLQRQK